MTDPLSLIALGAAVGGAAGKFVEKAWDSGEKWISNYFKNHRDRARSAAEENSAQFLQKLGIRLERLEKTGQVSSVEIEVSLDHPEFSVVLQKALLSAAQTENVQKHELLSTLVASHLQAKPESLLALVTKIACDVVGDITPNQLKLLGLIITIRHMNPGSALTPIAASAWMEMTLRPYQLCSISTLDVIHLQALACVQQSPFATDLWSIFLQKNPQGVDPSFRETAVFAHLASLWPKLQTMQLSSVGQILGVQVVGIETGIEVPLQEWGA